MQGKITLEITEGSLQGKKFEYEGAARVFIGRQDDCGIVLPENTVSRYHCLLTINPPTVRLQDFGSLNGTYLNGRKIGQRDRDKAWEEAREEEHDEFELHDGDLIRLGKRCEIRCGIEMPVISDVTISDEFVPGGADREAEAERARAEREKAEREKAEREKAERERIEKEEAERAAKEKAERERIEKEEAEKAAKERAEREKAEKEAREKAEREKAEKEAREKAEREKAEKAAREKAEKEAEEKAERERIEKEKAEKAAKEKAEKDAKEKAERERIAKEKAEKAAKEKAEKAAKEKAERERIAKEKAEKAAKEKAERERIEKEKAEKAAKEKAEKEKAAKQQALLDAGGKRICKGCGKRFTPTADDNNLCPACLADRAKMLDGILAALMGDAAAKREPSLGASPVEGYDKVALLGKGGMGEVWKVRERKTGKVLALKTMLPKVASDEKGKKMFLREASLCEQLDHKNVVKTYQTGCANGVFYILMDLCEGGSAQDLMEKRGGRLSLNLATYIILQTLSGLDYVHNLDVSAEIRRKGFRASGTTTVEAHGLVHRDFKPGNIFLSDKSEYPIAMVADFGMAKAFETAGMTDMTNADQASGTVAFMPRQQALDYRFAKPEVDVWAAAASYYYMLTGWPPKNLKPQPRLWQSIVTESAVPIRKRDSSIPLRLANVIDRALVEKPQIGIRTAAELRREIIAALPAETKAYCKGIL